ncbi:MAG: DoxX family membrane protein [Calditrichaeota bacterium]|nr:DoxX family membrane protein [Calditrichota bacterium]
MTGARVTRMTLVAARLFVGLVFVYAGVGKILDPRAFAAQVENYRLLPQVLVAFTAVSLPWAEVLAGGLLLLGRAVRPAALTCLFLEVVFLLAVGAAVARGLNIECGCFAGSHSLVGLKHLAEDFVLLVLTAWLYVRS